MVAPLILSEIEMSKVAILNISYIQFALPPEAATKILNLLSEARQTDDTYDSATKQCYTYVKARDRWANVSVKLQNAEIEACERPSPVEPPVRAPVEETVQ